MSKKKILTVIVVYNASKWLKACLESTQASTYPNDVVVVDNKSTDNCREITQEFEGVRLKALEENIGFGRANNVGLKIAMDEGYDFAFLLNGDAYYDSECLGRLIEVYEQNESIDLLAPVQLNGDGTKLDFRFKTYLGNNKQILEDLYFDRLKTFYPTGFVNAAAWLLPVHTIRKIGFFDPLFFIYGEDSNYLMRIKYHGLKTYVVPRATVRHDREEREGGLNYTSLKHQMRSQLLEHFLDIKNSRIQKLRFIILLTLHYVKKRRFFTFMQVFMSMFLIYGTISKHKKTYKEGLFEM